jgi:hypothetical protein
MKMKIIELNIIEERLYFISSILNFRKNDILSKIDRICPDNFDYKMSVIRKKIHLNEKKILFS